MIPSNAQKKLEDAVDIAGLHGMTARQRRMNYASAVYWGKQYDHLPAWGSAEAQDLPLREKAPRLQYRLTYRAINELVGYLFGEDRAPSLVVEGSVDPETGESSSNDNEVRQVNAALEALYADKSEGSGMKAYLPEVGRLGGLHGSVALAFHARPGRSAGETRWSTEVIETGMAKPTFGRDDFATAAEYGLEDDELVHLDEYWYSLEEDPVWGEETLFLHRREWTLTSTLEYVPVAVESVEEKGDLRWTLNEEASVEHDLGFLPVEWIPNIEVTNDIDGAPFLDVPEFSLEDAVNYTLSQLDRGVAYNQEPLTVFSGMNVNQWDEIKRGSGNTIGLPPGRGTTETKAELLELAGTGQQTAMNYLGELRSAFYEVAQIVMHDPQEAAGVQSGTALERMLRPMLMRIKMVRPNYGDRLARLGRKMLISAGMGEHKVSAAWGPLVHPTATDALQVQQAAIQALDAEGITRQTFIERIKPFYNIENVEEYVAQLEEARARAGTFRDPGTPEQQPRSRRPGLQTDNL